MSLRQGALVELAIDRLGAQGDGIGRVGGVPVRVPLALPEERWRVRLVANRRDGWDADAIALLEPAARAEPFCRHYPTCGGCRLQHLPVEAYRAHKRRRVADALARRGLRAAAVLPLLACPLGARRRLRLAWARVGKQVVLGLRQRRSRALVDLVECPVAAAPLVAEIAPLRARIAGTPPLGPTGEALLTVTDAGVDLALRPDEPVTPDATARTSLAEHAAARDLARLCLGGEPVVVRRPPILVLSGVAVAVPPGGFLQATVEGERALIEAVAAATRRGDHVVDLFAGIGRLGLGALRAGAGTVHAVEADAAAIEALRAANVASLTVERRDLGRRPLSGDELAGFDLAILDPPRAGAPAQVAELARLGPPRIVYASCDPESFARDAATLVAAGYVLGPVRPIDQFVGSAEVELVATLTRPARRPGRRA